MVELSEEMKAELGRRFRWCLCQVPELNTPTLIVFDYSPGDQIDLLSIAFDFRGGPKCWLSTTSIPQRTKYGQPRPHERYGRFRRRGRLFHPYSIKALPLSIFTDVEEITRMCSRFYEHVDWAEDQ